jgi:hypothetical protein
VHRGGVRGGERGGERDWWNAVDLALKMAENMRTPLVERRKSTKIEEKHPLAVELSGSNIHSIHELEY